MKPDPVAIAAGQASWKQGRGEDHAEELALLKAAMERPGFAKSIVLALGRDWPRHPIGKQFDRRKSNQIIIP